MPTDIIRIEFDVTRCSYYTQIDAVKVKGYAPVSEEAAKLLNQMNTEMRAPAPPSSPQRRNRTISCGNPSVDESVIFIPRRCLPPIDVSFKRTYLTQ